MGQRLEQNRTKITDNRNETERIKREQTILTNEYSPLREIDAFLDSLDDETIGSVEQVQEVGVSEQSRLNTEKEQTRSEANEIVSDLDAEIGKHDAGMKKLDQIETFGFGKQGVEKGKSDYQKQIEQYRALKTELEEIQESGNTSNLDQVMGNYADQISELNLDSENSGREIGSNSISNIPFSGIVNGNDISAIIDEHFDRVAPYSTATGFRDRFADELLLKIADAQGYNRAHRIVNENEFNQYAQASGYIGFERLANLPMTVIRQNMWMNLNIWITLFITRQMLVFMAMVCILRLIGMLKRECSQMRMKWTALGFHQRNTGITISKRRLRLLLTLRRELLARMILK